MYLVNGWTRTHVCSTYLGAAYEAASVPSSSEKVAADSGVFDASAFSDCFAAAAVVVAAVASVAADAAVPATVTADLLWLILLLLLQLLDIHFHVFISTR